MPDDVDQRTPHPQEGRTGPSADRFVGTPPEALLVQELAAIERIVGAVCRRHHLHGHDADDFAATVRLRLVEDDYEILRRFEGRCTLQTYLTVVIERLFLDYCAAIWGKWRPSAEARRLGPAAELYERLTVRDGLTFDEACETMRVTYGLAIGPRDLEALVGRLPARAKRQIVGETALATVRDAALSAPDEAALRADRARARSRAREALEAALAGLRPQDRLVLRLRFEDGLRVVEIARLLAIDQKPLYRRIDSLLSTLRQQVELRGINRQEIADWLDSAAALADDGGPSAWGKLETRPSI